MGVEQIIEQIKQKTASFDAGSYEGFLAVQVTLIDWDQVFYVEIKNGELSVEPYEYLDRQANLIISSDKFIKLINNELDPIVAFSTRQLKVEGDAGRALELSNLFKDEK